MAGRGRDAVKPSWLSQLNGGGGVGAGGLSSESALDDLPTSSSSKRPRGRSRDPAQQQPSSSSSVLAGAPSNNNVINNYSAAMLAASSSSALRQQPMGYDAYQPQQQPPPGYPPPMSSGAVPPSMPYPPPMPRQVPNQYMPGPPGAMPGGGGYKPPINPVALKNAKRVHVSGTETTTNMELRDFFNHLINSNLQQHLNPVVSAFVQPEKNYGFLELDSMELATALCNLGSVNFNGRTLRLSRPKDFDKSVAATAAGYVPDLSRGMAVPAPEPSNNKLYIAGLSQTFSEQDVKGLLEPIGEVKSLHIVREPSTKLSKGYGFFEFVDPAMAQRGIAALDGMQIGDKRITVRYAQQSQVNSGAFFFYFFICAP